MLHMTGHTAVPDPDAQDEKTENPTVAERPSGDEF